MTWQVAVSAYIVLATAAYLLRRQLAQSIPDANRIINAIFFVGFLYPLGVAIAVLSKPNLAIGWDNFVYVFFGSMLFPLVMVTAFNANKHIDAGLYTILNNLTPVVAIVCAYIFLAERLTSTQLTGSFIIIGSAFLASLPKLKHHAKSNPVGIYFALISIVLLGLGVVFEKWMLGRMDFGAYLIFGWGAQALWMAILAWPERKQLKIVIASKDFTKIKWYSITNEIGRAHV